MRRSDFDPPTDDKEFSMTNTTTAGLPTLEDWREREQRIAGRYKPAFVARDSHVPRVVEDVLPEFGRIRQERKALLEREAEVEQANRAAAVRRDQQIAARGELRREARLSGVQCDLPALVPVRHPTGQTIFREPEDGLEQLPFPDASREEWNKLHALLEAEEQLLLEQHAAALLAVVERTSAKARRGVERAREALARAEQDLRPFDQAAKLIEPLVRHGEEELAASEAEEPGSGFPVIRTSDEGITQRVIADFEASRRTQRRRTR